jgi:hypothetical protein
MMIINIEILIFDIEILADFEAYSESRVDRFQTAGVGSVGAGL